MYRLHGRDASLLYVETPSSPMHTMKIYLVELPEGLENPWQYARKYVEYLLDILPMLRQRPVPVPLGMHHTVMIEDPGFDLDYHLCRAALPEPGGKRELEEMISQIASHPLDQEHPLWELWMLDGLTDGRVAFVHKVHHVLADGMATVGYIDKAWHQLLRGEVPASHWQPEQMPSRPRLMWDALLDHFKYDIRNLPHFVLTCYRAARDMRAWGKQHHTATMMAMKGETHRCRWNRSLSPKRRYAMARIPLEDARAVKSKLGGKLNDVILCLCATSLRNYMLQHGELPGVPLVAAVPVSVDESHSARDFGNLTATMTTMLHVNVADPLARYEAIRASTDEAKTELDVMGRETYGMLMHYTPPSILHGITYNKYRRRNADRPDYQPVTNLVVANVPGPELEPMPGGFNISDIYSIGPLTDGVGLNITAWSYRGNLNFSIMGCQQVLPDIELIASGIEKALQELLALD